MSARLFKLLGLAAFVVGVSAIGVPSAGAGVSFDLEVTPVHTGVEQPTFEFEIIPPLCTDDPSITVVGQDIPVTVTLNDDNSGTFTLPEGTPGGTYTVQARCDTAEGDTRDQEEIEFGNVVVDKVVEGDAPDDAQFVVHVECSFFVDGAAAESYAAPEGLNGQPSSPLVGDVTFGAGGGTDYLVHYSAQDCTITEPQDGGADETTIETTDCFDDGPTPQADAGVSGDFSIEAPVDCTQTVTNVFAEEAATPAEITPTFTG